MIMIIMLGWVAVALFEVAYYYYYYYFLTSEDEAMWWLHFDSEGL